MEGKDTHRAAKGLCQDGRPLHGPTQQAAQLGCRCAVLLSRTAVNHSTTVDRPCTQLTEHTCSSRIMASEEDTGEGKSSASLKSSPAKCKRQGWLVDRLTG